MRQKPQNTVNSYRFIFSKVQLFLAFSSNFRSSALDILGFVLNLLSLGAWCSLLGGRGLGGGFLCFLGGTDSLFPLGFANLRLLVPFCHDILEGGSNNGALELLSSQSTILWGKVDEVELAFCTENLIANFLGKLTRGSDHGGGLRRTTVGADSFNSSYNIH